MKKLLLFICVAMVGAGVSAQTDTRDSQAASESNYAQSDALQIVLPDGYMTRDGRMMVVRDGRISVMKRETTLKNGTVLTIDGTYIIKGEKPKILKADEHLDLNGVVSKRSQQG